MKKYTNKELTAILTDMKNGAYYCGISNYYYGIGTISADKKFIYYNHYGASAIKCNITNLRWILDNIFTDCMIIAPAVYSEYHVNYIPVDKQYKTIDLSAKHPNVNGL